MSVKQRTANVGHWLHILARWVMYSYVWYSGKKKHVMCFWKNYSNRSKTCLVSIGTHIYTKNKANLRDLIAATGLVFLFKIGFKSLIFGPMWPGNLMEDLKKQQGTSSILCPALCVISKPSANSNWSYSLEMLNLGQNWWFFCPLWPQNLTDDLEKQ